MDKKDKSLMIAVDVMSRNKRKKMKDGGIIEGLKSASKSIKDFSNDVVPPQERSNESGGAYNRDSDPTGTRKMEKKPENRFAEGGEVMKEYKMDREDSIADSIMAKKDRMKQILDSGSMDEDEAMRFYEGGQVESSDDLMADIMSNGKEMPNAYFDRDEEILKENYDSDMDGMPQPLYSNEHGDDIISNKNDMINQIRSKMKRKGK